MRHRIIKTAIFLCGVATGLAVNISYTTLKDMLFPKETRDTLSAFSPEQEWNAFITAVGLIESIGDHRAVGKGDDVGLLQITPVLLKDANRILGYDKFSLKDRTNPEKSVEIWNIIQDHYNPEHDLQLAMKIWNPKAPLSYHRKIMAEFNRRKPSEEKEI